MEKKYTIAQLSRDLRVPFTRLYNAASSVGVKPSQLSEEDITKLVVELQQSSLPFTTLVSHFPPGTTLEELAQLEEEYISQKHRDLWNKRSQKIKKKTNEVDFFNIDVD